MKYKLFLIITLLTQQIVAQQLAKFKVQIGEDRIETPVSVSLDGINYNTDKGNLVLYEITPEGEKALPSQIESGHSARLWFMLKGVSVKKFRTTVCIKTGI